MNARLYMRAEEDSLALALLLVGDAVLTGDDGNATASSPVV